MGAAAPILAGAGLIKGFIDGDKQQKEANKSGKGAKDAAKRLKEISDIILGITKDADKGGAFDPETQIKQLEKDTAKYESEDMGGTAAAARIAGYQPGDTGVENIMAKVKIGYRQLMDNAKLQLRRSGVFDKIQAYQAATTGLGQSGQLYSQQQQIQQGQVPQAGGFLQTVMPFLNKPNMGAPAGAIAAAAGGGIGGVRGIIPGGW